MENSSDMTTFASSTLICNCLETFVSNSPHLSTCLRDYYSQNDPFHELPGARGKELIKRCLLRFAIIFYGLHSVSKLSQKVGPEQIEKYWECLLGYQNLTWDT